MENDKESKIPLKSSHNVEADKLVRFTDFSFLEKVDGADNDNLKIFREKEESAKKSLPTAIAIMEELEVELRDLRPILKLSTLRLRIPWADAEAVRSRRCKPPQGVRVLMEAVCILNGIEPWHKFDKDLNKIGDGDYWVPSRRLLRTNFGKFLNEMKDVEISEERVLKFQQNFTANSKFEASRDQIFGTFRPAGVVYLFLIGVLQYQAVLRLMREKRRQYDRADEIYNQALKCLPAIRQRIRKLERDEEVRIAFGQFETEKKT